MSATDRVSSSEVSLNVLHGLKLSKVVSLRTLIWLSDRLWALFCNVDIRLPDTIMSSTRENPNNPNIRRNPALLPQLFAQPHPNQIGHTNTNNLNIFYPIKSMTLGFCICEVGVLSG